MFGTLETLLGLEKYLRGITKHLELAFPVGLGFFTLSLGLANLLGQAEGPFYRQAHGITSHLILNTTGIR